MGPLIYSEDVNFSSDANVPCHSCGETKEGDWIQCEVETCKKWFHTSCVKLLEFDVLRIDKYCCKTCIAEGHEIIYKPILNKHRYDSTTPDPTMKLKTQIGTSKFIEDLKNKKFSSFECRKLNGDQLTFKYLKQNGFNSPIFIEQPEKLGMELPEDLNLKNLDLLIDVLDADYELEVIDVNLQDTLNITLDEFISSFKQQNRKKTYNCISLELSKTELSKEISPPKIVGQLSWADNVYEEQDKLPVSKYCLLSMKDSYTDFHIDFSGTSVWYHVVEGRKRFFFIEPTEKNIDAYEKWNTSDEEKELFFPDLIGHEKCFEFTLDAGNTMLIPAGWIHAVLTPTDSIVFGGNFLHSFAAYHQIRIYEMELRSGTKDKFKLPYFKITHWCATDFVYNFLKDLCETCVMTKEKIENSKICKDLFRSFESFFNFTSKYCQNMKSIKSKMNNCKTEKEKLDVLLNESDEYTDLDEFLIDYRTFKMKDYSRTLQKMKSRYLDTLRPDSGLKAENRNDHLANSALRNMELPQKSVSLKKKVRSDDKSLIKRVKSDVPQRVHHTNHDGSMSSNTHSWTTLSKKGHQKRDSNDTHFNSLPISQVLLQSKSSHKTQKQHTNSYRKSNDRYHYPQSYSNCNEVDIFSVNKVKASTNFLFKNLESKSLSNFKIPKKSKPIESETLESSSFEVSSTNSRSLNDNFTLPNRQESNASTKEQNWTSDYLSTSSQPQLKSSLINQSQASTEGDDWISDDDDFDGSLTTKNTKLFGSCQLERSLPEKMKPLESSTSWDPDEDWIDD